MPFVSSCIHAPFASATPALVQMMDTLITLRSISHFELPIRTMNSMLNGIVLSIDSKGYERQSSAVTGHQSCLRWLLLLVTGVIHVLGTTGHGRSMLLIIESSHVQCAVCARQKQSSVTLWHIT